MTGGTRTTAEEFFLTPIRMQLYSGDTALHVAAASYDAALARKLVEAGADVRARNRRGPNRSMPRSPAVRFELVGSEVGRSR